MKIRQIVATAGLVIASLGVTTAASARDHHNDRHHQTERGDRRNWNGNDRDGRHDRHDRDERHARYGRHDNGNHYGWRNGRGHHCHTEWRHHRQIRVCR